MMAVVSDLLTGGVVVLYRRRHEAMTREKEQRERQELYVRNEEILEGGQQRN